MVIFKKLGKLNAIAIVFLIWRMGYELYFIEKIIYGVYLFDMFSYLFDRYQNWSHKP